MNKSAKEKKYDNETAIYVIGTVPGKKGSSITSDQSQADKNDISKRKAANNEKVISGKIL